MTDNQIILELNKLGNYKPELSDKVYEPKDFIDIAKGNLMYALLLRQRVTWQHPETLMMDDEMEDEILVEDDKVTLLN